MKVYKDALVGVMKCPKTNKLYGVTIEVDGDKWTAVWSFPIKEETAKREGYKEQQFPPDLKYDKNYPGCPYCHKFEDLAELTKSMNKSNKPVSNNKDNNSSIKISVTTRGTDNIGAILDSLKIPFTSFNKIHFDCDLLFINCNTKDVVNPNELEHFVREGGTLYASDWAYSVLEKAFGSHFSFSGKIGKKGLMDALVVDKELKEIVGDTIKIDFNLGSWAVLNEAKGDPILLGGYKSQYHGLPIMVKVPYHKGLIFYTCFHNYAQANEQEQALLQLLVLKQIASRKGKSIEETSDEMGVDINAIKKKFKKNW